MQRAPPRRQGAGRRLCGASALDSGRHVAGRNAREPTRSRLARHSEVGGPLATAGVFRCLMTREKWSAPTGDNCGEGLSPNPRAALCPCLQAVDARETVLVHHCPHGGPHEGRAWGLPALYGVS